MKYHIITYGCQMNKSDSERIESVLLSTGMQKAEGPEEADVVIINSCSVRESAEHRVMGQVHNLNLLKKQNPNLKIALTGCMPGRDKDGKIKTRLEEVDFYFPIFEMIKLPEWLGLKKADGEYLSIRPVNKDNHQAFVTIQTGCEQFCTYCVVPYARGPEINRPVKDILEEIKDLAQNGCVEVTLLGQIVNNYIAPDPKNFSKNNPYQKNDFAKLLWEVNQVDGIKRIHWTGPHPVYMTDEIIDALTLPNQVNFLHLPVQSGSNEILRKMNRKHTREFYLDLIKKIKSKKPDIAIGTDIIVGFCGETEKDFQDTVDLYKQCDFDIAYLAQYSNRSGTAAAKAFKDDISHAEKEKRWFILQHLMEEIVMHKNQKFVGQTVSVLVDSCKDGVCVGNSSEMKMVSFSGDNSLIGKVVSVKIHEAMVWVLRGEIYDLNYKIQETNKFK